jgi:hypothetical protein
MPKTKTLRIRTDFFFRPMTTDTQSAAKPTAVQTTNAAIGKKTDIVVRSGNTSRSISFWYGELPASRNSHITGARAVGPIRTNWKVRRIGLFAQR